MFSRDRIPLASTSRDSYRVSDLMSVSRQSGGNSDWAQ